MQNRTAKKIEIKSWRIIRDGYSFHFRYIGEDPWSIVEFRIIRDSSNQATFDVTSMTSKTFPKIYFADREYSNRLCNNGNRIMFFSSSFSHHYENNELHLIGCNQHSDSIFMACSEQGLHAKRKCTNDDSYYNFIKHGLSVLALVDPSLSGAIEILRIEIGAISSLDQSTDMLISRYKPM